MSLLIFSSVLAVLFFWAVGAYNRLVVLRASVAKQFAAVDAQLLRVLVWLQGNLPASMRDMLSEMEEAALPEALLKNERDLNLLRILEDLSDSLDRPARSPCRSVPCRKSMKTDWPWRRGLKLNCEQGKVVRPRGSLTLCHTNLTASKRRLGL